MPHGSDPVGVYRPEGAIAIFLASGTRFPEQVTIPIHPPTEWRPSRLRWGVLWKPYQLARSVVVVEVNGYTIEPGANLQPKPV